MSRLIDKTQGKPVDRTAARVTSQSRTAFDADARRPKHVIHSAAPLPMRPLPVNVRMNPSWKDLTNLRNGRLTAIGLFDAKAWGYKKKFKEARWVVRCDCGRYEVRTAKGLLNPGNPLDRCWECWKLAELLKRRDRLDGKRGKLKHEY